MGPSLGPLPNCFGRPFWVGHANWDSVLADVIKERGGWMRKPAHFGIEALAILDATHIFGPIAFAFAEEKEVLVNFLT